MAFPVEVQQGLRGLDLIELSSINIQLVYFRFSPVLQSACGSTGSIRDDSHWTSRKNSLELIELSCINKVSLGFLL